MTGPRSAFALSVETSWETPATGVRRQVLSHGDDLMIVRVDFDEGAVGPVHHHVHRQATYVAAGRFEVSVGEERRVLSAGDSFFAAENVPHGVRALAGGTLIDAFSPARLDFLPTPPLEA
jgi:quercetin dioxygenase-like cupin family protein